MKKEKKELSQVTISQTVDHLTGEMTKETNVNVFRVDKEPDYVKLYINDIIKLNDLSPKGGNVLWAIIKRMQYDNLVILINFIIEEIAKECKTSSANVRKIIAALKKKDILLTRHRSAYLVNPKIFAKGKWEDIQKIRLSVEYGKDGRQMKAEFDRQTEIEFEEERAKELV